AATPAMTNPSSPLLPLIYASRVTPRGEADVDNVLESILADAVPLNRKRGLTSVLITHGDWFLQGLEGSPDAVRQAYAWIAKDRRHCNAVVRCEDRTTERLFPRWSLCARSLSVA